MLPHDHSNSDRPVLYFLMRLTDGSLTIEQDANPHFVGRDDVFESLDTMFEDGPGPHRVMLHGTGGIGKTQFAIQYAHRRKKRYRSGAVLLDASNKSSLTATIRQAVPSWKPGHFDDLLTSFMKLLLIDSKWLVILDNITNPEILDFFSKAPTKGDFILTSRDSTLVGSWHVQCGIALDLLTQEQSSTLFISHLTTASESFSKQRTANSTSTAAQSYHSPVRMLETLPEWLGFRDVAELQDFLSITGFLPLAVAQCASYLRQYPMSHVRYRERFEAPDPDIRRRLLEHRMINSTYNRSIMTTWEISVESLKREQPSAAELLTFLGFLECSDLVEQFLLDAQKPLSFWGGFGKSHMSKALADDSQFLRDGFMVEESFGRLSTLSLTKRRYGTIPRTALHPLLAEWTHLRLDPKTCAHHLQLSLRVLHHRLPPMLYMKTDFECPDQIHEVLSHSVRLKNLARTYKDDLYKVPLAPECALYFLEVYLYNGDEDCLDVAEDLSLATEDSTQLWLQSLIGSARLLQIITRYQAEAAGPADGHKKRIFAAFYHGDGKSAKDMLPSSSFGYPKSNTQMQWPSSPRVLMTCASLAYRVWTTLCEYDESRRVEAPHIQSIPKNILQNFDMFRGSQFSLSRNIRSSQSMIEIVSYAVLAQIAAADAFTRGEYEDVCDILETHQSGADQGLALGVEELTLYYETWISAQLRCNTEWTKQKTIELLGRVRKCELIKQLSTTDIDEFFSEHRTDDAVRRLMKELADGPGLVDWIPSPFAFNHLGEEVRWYEDKFEAVRKRDDRQCHAILVQCAQRLEIIATLFAVVDSSHKGEFTESIFKTARADMTYKYGAIPADLSYQGDARKKVIMKLEGFLATLLLKRVRTSAGGDVLTFAIIASMRLVTIYEELGELERSLNLASRWHKEFILKEGHRTHVDVRFNFCSYARLWCTARARPEEVGEVLRDITNYIPRYYYQAEEPEIEHRKSVWNERASRLSALSHSLQLFTFSNEAAVDEILGLNVQKGQRYETFWRYRAALALRDEASPGSPDATQSRASALGKGRAPPY